MEGFLSDLQRHAFLQHALWAAVLASVSAGIIGSFVVVKRMTYVAGGISHCILGGVGLALYGKTVLGLTWLAPMGGAVAAALAAALIIGLVTLRSRERADTVIGALWAVGMATGVLFLAKTPGHDQDVMSYLFGNILLVTEKELWLLLLLGLVILGSAVLFYRPIMAICFDEEFARLRRINVEAHYLLLLALTALAIVLLTTVVGVVMAIALLTLPAAAAGHLTRRLWQMMAVAIVLSVLCSIAGLWLSYQPDIPAGATIIILSGLVYLLVATGHWIHDQLARAARRG